MQNYFVQIDKEDVTVYEAEVVETNLVEVHHRIAKYKSDYPNWLAQMMRQIGNKTKPKKEAKHAIR